MNLTRCRRLIDGAIATFELDLSSRVLLTEAATNYYMLTPLIAALAGAEQVYALTRNSSYGTAEKIRDETTMLARRWGVDARIEVLVDRTDRRIEEADIVTNLGFVRPLDAAFLARLKPTVAVPLMWETWEWRPEDLDLAECRRLGIPVLGTNEHHPELSTFRYIGHIALKLLLESDIEVLKSRIVIVGSGDFAAEASATVRAAGAHVVVLDPREREGLRSDVARESLRAADALVVVEHHTREMLIGTPGQLEAHELCQLNPALVILHICGNVDGQALRQLGMWCRPSRFAPPGCMSVATDYVGPRPLIDLHTAGLKVGEILAGARLRGLAREEAESLALAVSPLCQGFPEA